MTKILNQCCAFFFAIALFISTPATAETAPPFSLVFSPGPGSQEGNGVAVDASGNIYVTGQFQGPATIAGAALTNAGAQDYFLASFDSNGNPRWGLGAGTSGSDYGTSVRLAANGDLLVSSSMHTPVSLHGTSVSGFGGRDAVLARYDSNGTLLWARAVGGGGADEGDDVAEDSNGSIFLAGRITGIVTIGSNTIGTLNNTRHFIAQFSATGEVGWARAVSQTSSTGTGVAVDGDDNVLVTGQGTLGFDQTLMVSKYNSNGTQLWQTNHVAFGGGTGIGVDSENNIYACGTFNSQSVQFGDTTLSNANFALRGYVVKYSPQGSPLWASRIGGRAYRVAVQSDGTVYACGFFLANSGNFESTTLTAEGSQDGFITKHDATGQFTWVKQAGSTSGEILRSITLDNNGKVYISGEGNATAFGLPPFSLSGNVVVARLDTSSATPGPVVSLRRSDNELILSWPASETGYEVKTTGDLTQPFGAAQVPLTPVPNQTNVFSTPLTGSNLFFRLVKP